MGQFDELGKVDSRFHARTVQHVDEVVRADIACGAGSKRTSSQSSDGCVYGRGAGFDSGPGVGDARVTGVVKVRAQWDIPDRILNPPEQIPHLVRDADADRVRYADVCCTRIGNGLRNLDYSIRIHFTLERAAEGHANRCLRRPTLTRRLANDVSRHVHALPPRCLALVLVRKRIRRADNRADFVHGCLAGAEVSFHVEDQSDVGDVVPSLEAGCDRLGVGHLRNYLRVDEAGDFQPANPGVDGVRDQFEFRLGRNRRCLVLQPVPRPDLTYLDLALTLVFRLCHRAVLAPVRYRLTDGQTMIPDICGSTNSVRIGFVAGGQMAADKQRPDDRGALNGLRAIELGHLIAGPFCGQLLADHGAEVIKVETPGAGDPMREWGRGKRVWWPVIGRNKKSITLNLRVPEGQSLLKELVATSDFLLENFRPGTMEKWGLGWDELRATNPRLIMIRVSGFGQTGPYAKQAGYGGIGEAMGGMRALMGYPDRPPSRAGLSIGDSLAGTFGCLGAMMALHHRERTGEGQVVDSAIYESVLAMMESTVPEYTEAGHVRKRSGSTIPKLAPSNVYTTRDGELLIGANQDSVWSRLVAAMEREDLASDPRFATHIARGENQVELDELINEWTQTLTTDELQALMDRFSVPAGRIYTPVEMLTCEHYAARKSLVKVEHDSFENLHMQNVFPKLSKTPGGVNWPGVSLGAHNEEIYGELLGYGSGELVRWREAGTI